VGWAESPYGTPPEGAAYGFFPYGGSGTFPAPEVPVSGGYGGDPYGLGSYGSSDVIPPHVTSVLSISGWEIEVFFSEEMDSTNPVLLDPASYDLDPIAGASPSIAVESVRIIGCGAN